MTKPLRGVNLGGWLVIEKWMTPSLFKGTTARNEFELAKTPQGRARIKKHHETFIAEADLQWLQNDGVQILRVPIGYWIFGDDTRYVGAVDRLDWLVATSLLYGFKLLLELHAAPGAQNRAAHSGSGNTVSDNHSTKWLNNLAEQEKTIKVLEQVAKRYSDSPNVWGIGLLNEPSIDWLGLKLARFHRKAYARLAKIARPGTRIVFSDGYAPFRTTNTFWLRAKKHYPVVLDCHIYQAFGKASKKRTFNQTIKRTALTGIFLRLLRLQQPLVIGEWSAALPRRTSAVQTSQYIAAQRAAFSCAQAEFYWSYKMEGASKWHYRYMVNKMASSSSLS